MPVVKISPHLSSPPWDVALEEFLLHKQAEGREKRTLDDYRYHLTKFLSAHGGAWPDYHRLKLEVRKHFAGLAERSATTYNLRREYLLAFFNWCVAEGYLPANPAQGLPKRRDEERPRHVDGEAIEKLLAVIDRNTYTGLRDYCLLLFQLDTGIRPGEALALPPGCFDLRLLQVHIPAGIAKTHQARIVVISPQVGKALKKLLAVRPKEWGEDIPLFASQDGSRMRERSWAHRLRKYADKAGVKVTPYMLRHTAAIMSLRNGASPFYVQRQLGHTTLARTRRYAYLVEGDLHREHATASPVAGLIPHRQRARRKLKEKSRRKAGREE